MQFIIQLFHRAKSKVLIIISASILFSACNKQALFQYSSATNNSATADSGSTESRVEKMLAADDKITVSVWEHDDLSVGNLQSVVSLQEEFGKWVMLDANGEVKLPQIGTVKLGGLTVREATMFLEKSYSQFVQKPNVNIRVLNNQVTLLGEVRTPGNYIFSTDNIRLVELIGKAQGFTDYGRTTNIKIIRGEKQFKVDLTNAYNVSNKDVIIYPGDVVYVPPSGNKPFDRFTSKMIPIASLLTAVALIYSITENNK